MLLCYIVILYATLGSATIPLFLIYLNFMLPQSAALIFVFVKRVKQAKHPPYKYSVLRPGISLKKSRTGIFISKFKQNFKIMLVWFYERCQKNELAIVPVCA
jgi:hypothetical protein